MKGALAALVLLTSFGPTPAVRGESIVPAADRIDDRAAKLALAEQLSLREETRAEARSIYIAWVAAHPADAEAIIALARLETWTGRGAEAVARLELLAPQGTLTPGARAILAEGYMQAGRLADAARIYDELLAAETSPGAGLLLAAGNARSYAGRPAEALPFYRRAVEAAPADAVARRNLGLALAWTGAGAEARPLLEEAARERPGDEEVARALASMAAGDPRDPGGNLARLRGRVGREPGNPTAKADLADLEASRGHAADARALYAEARRLAKPEPGDAFDLRQARARLIWGDFYPAERALRAALAAVPGDDVIRGELLSLLVSMDRLEEAEALALAWLRQNPASQSALTRLADTHTKRRDPDAAAPYLARLPAKVSSSPEPGSPAARFAVAGREGVRDEKFVLAITADADRHQARGETRPAGLTIPETAPRLTEWAGLYAGQGDFELALRCLRAARLADAEYFPAWLNLAEFLAITQRYDEALREFAALASAFPENRQVLLKQARALGWSRRYDESLAAYEALRALNPADPVPLLEQARVAGWAKERSTSARLFALRWARPADTALAAGLRAALASVTGDVPAVVRAWRDWAAGAEKADDQGKTGPAVDEPFRETERFESELPLLLAAVPAGKRTELEELRLGLRAEFLLQRAFWLENRAKQLAWDRRWWRSEQAYDRLLAVAPGNQEARFDLSQVQAAQGLGNRERLTLDRLLAIDANNRLAVQARFRRERRSEPLVFAQIEAYRERGRGELSGIHRLRTRVGGEVLFDDRFRLDAAWIRWRESPDTLSRDFEARGFALGAEGVPANWLTVSADYTHKDNEEPQIGSVDTGGAQAWVPFKDGFKVGAGIEVREELANVFAYYQGIRSTHRWLGARAALSRRLEVEARVATIDYADGNAGRQAWIAPAYTWTDHPRTFKTTLTLETRDTDKANIYQYAGPALANIVHPYWTPENHLGAAVALEWRHDLARDFFIGAQEQWYDLRATFSASNDGNQGVSLEADYAREWLDRWVIRLGFAQTFSEQWDDRRVHARLAFRF